MTSNIHKRIQTSESDAPSSPSAVGPHADTNSLSQHASGTSFLRPALIPSNLVFLGLCGFKDLGLMSSSTKGRVSAPTRDPWPLCTHALHLVSACAWVCARMHVCITWMTENLHGHFCVCGLFFGFLFSWNVCFICCLLSLQSRRQQKRSPASTTKHQECWGGGDGRRWRASCPRISIHSFIHSVIHSFIHSFTL